MLVHAKYVLLFGCNTEKEDQNLIEDINKERKIHGLGWSSISSSTSSSFWLGSTELVITMMLCSGSDVDGGVEPAATTEA